MKGEKILYCLTCNYENSDTAQFCDHCGTLLYASYKAQLRNNERRMLGFIESMPIDKKTDVNLKLIFMTYLLFNFYWGPSYEYNL
ncbi:hypothetical protein D3C76_1495910 [compost metagenome]